MRRRVRAHSAIFLLALSLALGACRGAVAVEKDPTDREAEDLLVRYIRIDTSNPPGNETAAATFLQEVLTKEGIDAQLVGSNPARRSIYARLKSGSSEPALLLLHHTDVVPASADQWTVPPFSAERSGGYIWGRGALDVKSLGIASLMAVLDLKRSGAALTRDVVFLGVADEEAGGTYGLEDLLKNQPDLFQNVGFVLNEGGGNETIVDHVSFWGIEVDQKVPLWLRVVARGGAGHGAVPPEDGGASARLVEILHDIQQIKHPYRVTDSVAAYFRALSVKKPGIKGQIMRNLPAYLASPELEQQLSPAYQALLRDTVAITRLEAGDLVNSIPAVASGELDMRLLPDTDSSVALADVRRSVGERGEVQVILQGKAAPPSSTKTELFDTLETVLKRAEPNSVVGPSVSAGTSDSRFFRARGVVAYGISPFKVNYYDANTVHGVDERIRARFFIEGVHVMRDLVREFCVKRSG